jgi:hypothetical protein
MSNYGRKPLELSGDGFCGGFIAGALSIAALFLVLLVLI